MKKLPDKLSDLFTVALDDLERCIADPRYEINMRDWISLNTSTKKCEVCMAGAVMAKTLDITMRNTDPWVEIGDENILNKIYLTDNFRTLDFRRMFESRGMINKWNDFDTFCTSLEIDIRKAQNYIPQYRKIINKMKEMGL